MKKIIAVLAAMTLTVGAFAMPYSSARKQALFLTDKMAYELNLTDGQYNAAYEINLDYFMNVDSDLDIFGFYWDLRDSELRYILTRRQYRLYKATEYFYRPINWTSNAFSFLIYSHYARDRFFRPAPRVYVTYSSGHVYHSYHPYIAHNEPVYGYNYNHMNNHGSIYNHSNGNMNNHNNGKTYNHSNGNGNVSQPRMNTGSQGAATSSGTARVAGTSRSGNSGRR